jgi:hypothetical protein
MCVKQPLPSQIMCAGNGHLLRVGPYIIACRWQAIRKVLDSVIRFVDRVQGCVGRIQGAGLPQHWPPRLAEAGDRIPLPGIQLRWI